MEVAKRALETDGILVDDTSSGAAKLVPPPVKPASSAAPGALRGREPCDAARLAEAGDGELSAIVHTRRDGSW